MKWLTPLFRKLRNSLRSDHRPSEFSLAVTVQFSDTWEAEFTMRTGAQVASFSGDFVARDVAFYVYCFDFEYESMRYSFRCTRDPKKLQKGDAVLTRLNIGDETTAYIDGTDLSKCWFAGEIRTVFPWEPDEEEVS